MLLTTTAALRALGYLTSAAAAYFFYRLYQVRMLFRRTQKQYGLTMIPHSFLFGHLWTIGQMTIRLGLPPDLSKQWFFLHIKEEFPDAARHGVIYVDTWPIGHPMVVVWHPAIITQFTQTRSLPKFYWQREHEFKRFTAGRDLLNLEGAEWKAARATFNPGFSAKNLLSLVPGFVEEVLVFRDRLRAAAAAGEVFRMLDWTTDLTFDIIGRAVLGARMRSQEGHSPAFVAPFRAQLRLLYFTLDLPKQLNPLRLFNHWRYNRAVRRGLAPYILDASRNYSRDGDAKTIVNLAVRSYVSEMRDRDGGAVSAEEDSIPPQILEDITVNIKMFLFAGHDTTSTTLAAAYYLLSRPGEQHVLARVREEHDAVLGPDRTAAASRISADPALLNRLPYTLAFLKETLRLFPPVGGGIRESPRGWELVHPDSGQRFPTYGFMIHGSGATLGRSAEYFPRPHEFVPERWLVRDESDPMHPAKNTWRPFELGPRNCIGQELVMIELRLILALTVREFDMESDYGDDAPTWFGHAAYLTSAPDHVATSHLKDHLPLRARLRKAD